MILTNEEREKIWGETGPYSEVYFIIETRILDDETSRMFLKVEVTINPFTFEFIQKHKEHFTRNKRILDILQYGRYVDEKQGYHAPLFCVPYDRDMLEIGTKVLNETEIAIKKMHTYIMNNLDRYHN